jgi:hypothetical protein
MTVLKTAVRLAAVATLTLAGTVAHAAYTFTTTAVAGLPTNIGTPAAPIYVNAAAIAYQASLVNASGIDSFGDLTIDPLTSLGTSLVRNAGPIGYTASTTAGLYAIQSPGIGGPSLSVEGNTDTLLFNTFSTGVYNFGARFYLSELNAGNVFGGTMTVRATDINNVSQNFTFSQSAVGSGLNATEPTLYFRLGSDVALQSVELIAPTPGIVNPNVFVTADNVVLGTVPLPSTWLMMLAGSGALLRLASRRRA